MTRHPKSGKGLKWTVKELQAVPASWVGDCLGDGGGLVGDVRVSKKGIVSVHFQYSFRWQGKLKSHSCGTWPHIPLEEIRHRRDTARSAVKAGINPNDLRKAQKIEAQRKVEAIIAQAKQDEEYGLTLRDLFNAWIKDGVLRKDNNTELRRSIEKDLLAKQGNLLIQALTEHDLRAAIRKVVERGSNFIAEKLCADIVQMFAWAEKRQPWRRLMLEGNPAALLEIKRIVPADCDLARERDRILSVPEIQLLRNRLDQSVREHATASNKRTAKKPIPRESQLALWICLSTLCRIGELLMAEWRHVDLTTGEWFIPEENAKGTRGKKQPQLIFLSDFSKRMFAELHTLTGTSKCCFPGRDGKEHISVKAVTKQVGDRQFMFKDRKKLSNRRNDDSLVLDLDRGEWTPHDLRRTGATMMQALSVPIEVIDRCQNHVIKGSRVRRHYLHYEYVNEKRAAWQAWGQELDRILQNIASPPIKYPAQLVRIEALAQPNTDTSNILFSCIAQKEN